MSKVYVVISGEFSEQDIEGVFSSREKAAEFGFRPDGDDDGTRVGDGWYRIEEFDLDELLSRPERLIVKYRAQIRITDGRIHVERRNGLGVPGRRCLTEYTRFNASWNKFIAVTSTVSAEHAAKVAAEKRQEWLRMNPGWGPGERYVWDGPESGKTEESFEDEPASPATGGPPA